MADVSIKSVDLLRQYLGKFREFANAVDVGVLALKQHLESRKEELQAQKSNIDNMAAGYIANLDYRISQLESYKERLYDMCEEDLERFDCEILRNERIRDKLETKISDTKDKIDKEIGVLNDILELTYSYGNRVRTMAETGNGKLAQTIVNIEKYDTI